MLALCIRYLNGFAAASEPNARERAEWPPHPGRVFMALAAAHFQTGAEPDEREALLWIEGLPAPPLIQAVEAMPRAVMTHYVPVNDKAGGSKALLQCAPLTRDRQPRTFARVWLEHDTVYVAWQDADPPDPIRRAIESLCAKVTRIGHSSSLVQMWVAESDENGEPNWVADDDRAAIHLRVAGPGTLEDLERRYNAAAVDTFAALQVTASDSSDETAQSVAKKRLKDEFSDVSPTRIRPEISLYQGYAPRAPQREAPRAVGTVFSPQVLVFTLETESGPYGQLDLACVLAVAQRWREAIVSHSNDLPERARHLLSGHNADGAPLSEPHVAFLPLAFVGHPHADGHLVGMALALPENVPPDERRSLLRAIGRVQQLRLGRLGVWNLQRDASARPSWNLRAETWSAYPHGATRWSTVTPIVFDRHPKANDPAEYQREVGCMIATACESIGLPTPRELIVTAVSVHLGVPPAHAFPRLQRKDGSERRHSHAILVFDCPVRGPILLGAGRYRGYGLCRPMHDDGAIQTHDGDEVT